MKTWNYASLEDLMANVSEVTMAAVKQTVKKTYMLPYNTEMPPYDKIVYRIQGIFEMEAIFREQLENEMAIRDAAREDKQMGTGDESALKRWKERSSVGKTSEMMEVIKEALKEGSAEA